MPVFLPIDCIVVSFYISDGHISVSICIHPLLPSLEFCLLYLQSSPSLSHLFLWCQYHLFADNFKVYISKPGWLTPHSPDFSSHTLSFPWKIIIGVNLSESKSVWVRNRPNKVLTILWWRGKWRRSQIWQKLILSQDQTERWQRKGRVN